MRLSEKHMRANLQDQGLVFVCRLLQLDQRLRFQQLSIWNGKRASRGNLGKLRSDLHWERKKSKYKRGLGRKTRQSGSFLSKDNRTLYKF
jgi:hypothetical protein